MIEAVIDYRNLQFIIYQDGKPADNTLPAEVQRVVIKRIIDDYCACIVRQLNEQLSSDPVVKRQSTVH